MSDPLPTRSVERLFPFVLRARILLIGRDTLRTNKGKQTVAYRPLACERERDAIDEVLIDVAKLPKRFQQALKSFVKVTVVVDETDAKAVASASSLEACRTSRINVALLMAGSRRGSGAARPSPAGSTR